MKGSLNKGFFSYLMLFVGLLLACALVLLTIMIFSPGTSILGYCYVSEKTVYKIETYNGDDGSVILDDAGEQIQASSDLKYIDFTDLAKLLIKSNYSSVKFRRGDFSRITVKTTVKAFARKKDLKDVVVYKSFDEKTKDFKLVVDDQKYLWTLGDNREIEITMSEYDMEKMAVQVDINKGNISFENDQNFSTDQQSTMQFKSIVAKTNKGNIALGQEVNPYGGWIEVNLCTESGDIITSNINAIQTVLLNILPEVTLQTKNGSVTTKDIYAQTVVFGGENVHIKTGDICAKSSLGLDGTIDLQVKSGIVEFGKVEANIVDSQNVCNNVKLDTKDIQGSIVLTNLGDSDVTLGKVDGNIYINTKGGNVNVELAKSKTDISTENGKININIQKGSESDIKQSQKGTNLTTKKGAISVKFLDVLDQCNIISEKANVTVYYNQEHIFKLEISAKKIEYKNENKTIEGQAIGYPSTSNSQIDTDKIVKISTDANVQVYSFAE